MVKRKKKKAASGGKKKKVSKPKTKVAKPKAPKDLTTGLYVIENNIGELLYLWNDAQTAAVLKPVFTAPEAVQADTIAVFGSEAEAATALKMHQDSEAFEAASGVEGVEPPFPLFSGARVAPANRYLATSYFVNAKTLAIEPYIEWKSKAVSLKKAVREATRVLKDELTDVLRDMRVNDKERQRLVKDYKATDMRLQRFQVKYGK